MASASRLGPFLELLTGLALLELDLWWLRSLASPLAHGLALAALGVLLARIYWRRRGTDRVGVRPSAARAYAEAGSATLLAAAVLVVAASLLREPYEAVDLAFVPPGGASRAEWIARRLGIAVGQQVGLQLFLLPTCAALLGGAARGAPVAVLVFGLLHLPSAGLAALAAAAAALWILLYRRGRRLAPLIASHLALAALLQATLPERLHYGLEVGRAGLAPHARAAVLGREEVRATLRRVTTADFYKAHGGTDRAYLRALFRELLGREPTPAELPVWEGSLASRSRGAVAAELVVIASRQRDWAGAPPQR